jgi:hypothetical protein
MTVWPLSLQTQGVTVIVSVILEVQEVLVRGNEARQTWRSIFRALVSEMKGARLPGPPLSRLGEQIGRGLTSKSWRPEQQQLRLEAGNNKAAKMEISLKSSNHEISRVMGRDMRRRRVRRTKK